MKKIILSTLIVGALAFSATAQNDTATVQNDFNTFSNDFKKWSVDVNGGFNKAMAPMTPGYYAPTLNLGHVDLGFRYMFNENFGAKLDYGFGKFVNSQSTEDYAPFETNYYRLNLQGVANLGRIMSFETFTRRVNLLGHFGAGIGRVTPQENFWGEQDFQDNVYNFIFGLTGQVKLSENIALNGDVSTILNGRQDVSFDGARSIHAEGGEYNGHYGTNGVWWTGTLGLSFYLGSGDVHADWYIRDDMYATKVELANQIGEIKDMLKDSDGDGIPDYLDKEPNTPSGARVDSQGRTTDSDGDGIPDHLDECPFVPGPASGNGCPPDDTVEQIDYFRQALNDGYVNVYFAFDSARPLGYSASAANYVANFLRRNPGVSVEIKGYADELGPDDYNMKLSERRAKAVYDIVIAAGIEESRLSYQGYGEDTSVDKSSADARQLARRVSFEVQ